jgi:hypothetical protein
MSSVSSRAALLRALHVIVVAIALPVAAGAQRIDGRLLESGSSRPIVLGTVALLDTAMIVVDETYTNESGEFSLVSDEAGEFYILAQRAGYHRKVDGVVELGEDGLLTVAFYLRPIPFALDSLEVESQRRLTTDYLDEVGFYERVDNGSAWFLQPAEIELSNAVNVARLLHAAPGASIVEHSAGPTLLFRSHSVHPGREGTDPVGFCTPRVLVNGAEVGTHWSLPETAVPGAMIDDAVDVDDIAAIEVHTGPASMPLIYGGSVDNGCATVLIWTFQARRVPRGR